MQEYVEADVLIIGGGIAGSVAAMVLAENGVKTLLINKGKNESSTNTYLAQGGIAALNGSEDPEVFIQDILKSGDMVNYEPAVRELVTHSRELVKRFIIEKIGVQFSRKNGKFDLAREGAHSSRRVLNVKDMTGRVIQEKLAEYMDSLPKLKVMHNHTAIDILTFPHHSQNPIRQYLEAQAVGAYVLDQKTGKVKRAFARKVVLASGGLSSIFLNSTNPAGAVGNGIAMAYRAGARLANLEYVQFHPTSLYHKEGDSFLISEAVRGEGARLLNRKGDYFMSNYSEQADLAPRDEVSRAIYEEMIRHGDDYVLLDLASFTRINIPDRFPTIYRKCLDRGIDITRRPIPVVPAAHFSCGGVLADLQGRTTLKNLYAIGEVSCTGVHGANRLASVSLLEGLVWGVRSAQDICKTLKNEEKAYTISEVPKWKYPCPHEELDPALVWQDMSTIRYTMWNYSGIIRTRKRLDRARSDLEYLRHRILKFYHKTVVTDEIINLRDSVQTALLVVHAALRNKVSRGTHFIVGDQ